MPVLTAGVRIESSVPRLDQFKADVLESGVADAGVPDESSKSDEFIVEFVAARRMNRRFGS